MQLASVLHGENALYGAVTPRGFVDFTAAFAGHCGDLRQWLQGNHHAQAEALLVHAPALPLEQLIFRPPIPNADARMFAIGWSYRDHQTETGATAPKKPFIFQKLPSSLVGHGQPLVKPWASDRFDYEGEIVVVIGTAGRHIAPENAMAHIAGYTIAMDGSMRDWQQDSVTAGKNFDQSSACGPWIVTADAMANPAAMELVTRRNDEEMQRARFSDMVWGIPALVAYVSTLCRLEVGDSISTGTPAGVGNRRVPPVYLQASDTLSVEVSGLGTLTNPVIDETPPR